MLHTRLPANMDVQEKYNLLRLHFGLESGPLLETVANIISRFTSNKYTCDCLCLTL
jgi:hypothetical protein